MKKGQIGIELGTKHLRICTTGKDQFLRLKNVIAINQQMQIAATGNDAFLMFEKEPHEIQIITPMTHGVIGDYTNMRLLLSTVLRKYFRRLRKYQVYIAAPADITGVEKRAFYDLVWESAARVKEVHLLSKPMLDALGAGLDVYEPCGNMMIDFGSDTTEISVISLGGIVKSRLLKYGGSQIDQWIIQRMKREYNIDIGRRTAERLKIRYSKNDEDKNVVIKGRDLVTGLPKKMTVAASIPEEKVKDYIYEVILEARRILEVIPPELASDIMINGIYMTGGGASFQKIKPWMEEELKMPVYISQQPDDSVIRGLKLLMMSESK